MISTALDINIFKRKPLKGDLIDVLIHLCGTCNWYKPSAKLFFWYTYWDLRFERLIWTTIGFFINRNLELQRADGEIDCIRSRESRIERIEEQEPYWRFKNYQCEWSWFISLFLLWQHVWDSHVQWSQAWIPTLSSPGAAILLVSTKNRDLWPPPTPEIRDSRTHCQIWQIWLAQNYRKTFLRMLKNWDWPEFSILGVDQKDRGLWGRMIWQPCDVRPTFQLSQIILYCAGFESYIRKIFGIFALLKRKMGCLAKTHQQ